MLAAAVVFFVVNTALVATVIALAQRARASSATWSRTSSSRRPPPACCSASRRSSLLAADFALPAVALLFLPLLAVHRGGREAIAKEHQALHDALTGLPNRDALPRPHRAGHPRSRRRTDDAAVVMLMDLDHFKEINDTLGHHHGRPAAPGGRRAGCSASLRDADTVARLGGDEFGVLLPRIDTRRRRRASSPSSCSAELREPFMLEGMTLEIDASIGIAAAPAARRRRRDAAASAPTSPCTRPSRPAAATRSSSPSSTATRRAAWRWPARCARRSTTARSRSTTSPRPTCARAGSSASRRSRAGTTRSSGIVGPSEFVPIAEQTGLITPLTSFVLDAALRQVREWQDAGLELSVAVNLSARSFLDTQLAVEIPRLLEPLGRRRPHARARDHREHADDRPGARRGDARRGSAQIGLTLSVDDFGTGYSSLANLKRLPVDVIKIDKSFVMEMAVDASDAAIVRSTIDLAHNLGLRVVAEGVESEDAWRQLEELGCDFAQGYYLSRPLPPGAVTRLIPERAALEMLPTVPQLRVVQGLAR